MSAAEVEEFGAAVDDEPLDWESLIKVELSHPIQVHGKDVFELEFRPPRMRDVKSRDGADGDTDAALRMLACLANVPPPSMGLLILPDYAKCEAALAPFFATLLA